MLAAATVLAPIWSQGGPPAVMAMDRGRDADPGVLFYSASVRENKLGVTATHKDLSIQPVLTLALNATDGPFVAGGLAARDGKLVATLTNQNELLFIDARRGVLTARQSLPDFSSPRGAAFDPAGRLWVLSGNSLAELQFTADGHFNPIHHRGDFDDPRHLAIDAGGHFYIAQIGQFPTVAVLDRSLKTVRTIGRGSQSKTGLRDPLQLTPPDALAVDDAGRLWLTECASRSRRLTVWDAAAGRLLLAVHPAAAARRPELTPPARKCFQFPGAELRLYWHPHGCQ